MGRFVFFVGVVFLFLLLKSQNEESDEVETGLLRLLVCCFFLLKCCLTAQLRLQTVKEADIKHFSMFILLPPPFNFWRGFL